MDLRPEAANNENIAGEWTLDNVIIGLVTNDTPRIIMDSGDYVEYDRPSDQWTLNIGSSPIATFSGGGANFGSGSVVASGVESNGNVTVTSGDLKMAEKADHTSTPGAGFGYLWTKSTTPSTLIFTDDAGTDFTLGAAGGGSGDILADGSIPMTASWNMGGFGISNVGTLACSTFTSTGIDDNATGEVLQLSDTAMDVGGASANFQIVKAGNDNSLVLSGGNGSIIGANVLLYGGNHGSQANDFIVRAGSSQELKYDDSASTWDFQANDVTIGGGMVVAGAIVNDTATGNLNTSGGDAANAGANLKLYGQTHSTLAYDIQFRSDTTDELYFDYSANSWDFQANDIVTTGIILPAGASGPKWTSGSGTPEGALTAVVGSMYTRTDGGAGTTLYIKETGTGNTGWRAV